MELVDQVHTISSLLDQISDCIILMFTVRKSSDNNPVNA